MKKSSLFLKKYPFTLWCGGVFVFLDLLFWLDAFQQISTGYITWDEDVLSMAIAFLHLPLSFVFMSISWLAIGHHGILPEMFFLGVNLVFGLLNSFLLGVLVGRILHFLLNFVYVVVRKIVRFFN